MLPKKFKGLVFFDPLFWYTPGKGVTVYYNFTDPKQSMEATLAYLEKNMAWFRDQKTIFDADSRALQNFIARGSVKDVSKMVKLIHEIWPMVAVAHILGSTESLPVSDDLRALCIQIRYESDDVLHPSLTQINKLFAQKRRISTTQHLMLTEALRGQLPNDAEQKTRAWGWVYHKGKIMFDVEKYQKAAKIRIDVLTEKDGMISRCGQWTHSCDQMMCQLHALCTTPSVSFRDILCA